MTQIYILAVQKPVQIRDKDPLNANDHEINDVF